MALPMTLIIITGEIDLSVASILALSAELLGYLWMHHWPMALIFVVVLGAGTVAGAINGLLITRVGLPSLAVTIGTLTLYRGLANVVLGPNTVSNFPTRSATSESRDSSGSSGCRGRSRSSSCSRSASVWCSG
jgi:rhamnose transport system permease protein